MQIFNTAERYGAVAQFFHWVIAVLILMLLPMGLYMSGLPDSTGEEVAAKVWFYSLHKTIGVTVLAFAIVRIIWAFVNPRPVPLHPERKLETLAAETVHWMLYAAILLVPLAGLLHHASSTGFAQIWWPFSQDLPGIPKDVHLSETLGFVHWALAGMMAMSLAAHIGGALKHVVIDRDETLARMTPSRKPVRIPGIVAGHGASKVLATLVVAGVLAGSFYLGWTAKNAPMQLAENTSNSEAVAPVTSAQSDWLVDHENSALAVRISQMGSPVDGTFNQWSAAIEFDPEALDQATVEVIINTSSLSLGSVSDQAISSDFLDAAAFPVAIFSADEFRATGEGSYEAVGTLTIHGVEQPFTLPFDLTISGDKAVMHAEATLNRLDFGVGEKGFSDEGSVGFQVDVIVDIEAGKAGSQDPQS